jgi:hypothetical protein
LVCFYCVIAEAFLNTLSNGPSTKNDIKHFKGAQLPLLEINPTGSVPLRHRGDKSGASDSAPSSLHHLFVGAPLHHARRKFFVTPNGLCNSLAILYRRKTRIDALPESLGEGHSFGNR